MAGLSIGPWTATLAPWHGGHHGKFSKRTRNLRLAVFQNDEIPCFGLGLSSLISGAQGTEVKGQERGKESSLRHAQDYAEF